MEIVKLTIKAKLILFFVLLASNIFCQTNTIKFLTDLGTNYDYSYSIELQSDGKVIQAGDAWGTPCMIRFNLDGILDHTFGTGGKVFAPWSCGSNPSDNDIVCQPDGKIILGTSYFNGNDEDFIVARYNSDGTLDNSFGAGGKVITPIGLYNDICNAIAIQSDGKILAAGGTNNASASNYKYDFALVRYSINGEIDTTFGTNGVVITNIGLENNIAYSMVVQPDDKVILVGEANDGMFCDFAVVRYRPDGALDNSFGNNGIVRTEISNLDDFAKSVILQPDGKILAAGSTRPNFHDYDFAIVRYNINGTPDSTFGTNGIVMTDKGTDFGQDIALQPDGKIILVGSSTTGTIYDIATLCYDSTGVLDNSFGINGLISTSLGDGDSEGHAVCLKDNGEILIAGSYNHGAPDYFDFASVWLFSDLNPVSKPLLIAPLNGTTDLSKEVTFLWSIVPGAISYIIQVSTSSDFSTLVANDTITNSTGHVVDDLSYNTTFYWRVNATVNGATSDWTDVWIFSTEDDTGIPEFGNGGPKIYPVPAKDKLFIEGIELKNASISIISANGMIINQMIGLCTNEIDLSGLTTGIYVIKISNERTNYLKLFTKK